MNDGVRDRYRCGAVITSDEATEVGTAIVPPITVDRLCERYADGELRTDERERPIEVE